MASVTIHDSGTGANRLRVDSEFNGLNLNVRFGEAGSCMSNVYLQGDEAAAFRAEYEAREVARPHAPCRDHWLAVVEPYLP